MSNNINRMLEIGIGIFVFIVAITNFINMQSSISTSIIDLESGNSKFSSYGVSISKKDNISQAYVSRENAQYIVNSFYLSNTNDRIHEDAFMLEESEVKSQDSNFRVWVSDIGYLDASSDVYILQGSMYEIKYIISDNSKVEEIRIEGL